ncbi:MAG: hypothetical protein WC635_10545 [Bacteriovorax sp.]
MLIFAIGIGIGYRIELKLYAKKQDQKQETLSSSSILEVKPQGFIRINFVSPLVDEEVVDESLKSQIENLMSSKNIQFFLHFGGKSRLGPAVGNKSDAKINMGAIEPSRIVEMRASGVQILPIFTASLNPSGECYSEIQIVSNGSIEKIEDLNGKNIGVISWAMPLSILTFKKLKERNITFGKIYSYQNNIGKAGLADLKANKIDALVVKTLSQSAASNEPWSSLGVFKGETYLEYPKFKILSSSNDKVPCKVIFINSFLPGIVREEISNKLESLLSKPETQDVFSKGIHIASIQKLTAQNWKAIEDLLQSIRNTPLTTFASEVIKK